METRDIACDLSQRRFYTGQVFIGVWMSVASAGGVTTLSRHSKGKQPVLVDLETFKALDICKTCTHSPRVQ
jgi:hypothetical protein